MKRMNQSNAINKVIRELYCYSDKILLSGVLSPKRLMDGLQAKIINNPELFAVVEFELVYHPLITIVYPKYYYDRLTYNTKLDLCRKTANRLVERIDGRDDYSKAVQAHDFLARNVIYVDGTSKELHTIVGAFTKKQAVCDGFSMAYKYLLDLMNIPCISVGGYACDHEKGVYERHSWNMVCFDGNWTHVDVTFDTTIRTGSELRYDYFGLTDAQIIRDHKYEMSNYPRADYKSFGYYK